MAMTRIKEKKEQKNPVQLAPPPPPAPKVDIPPQVKPSVLESTTKYRYLGLGLEIRIGKDEFTFEENQVGTMPTRIFHELRKHYPAVFTIAK